MKRLGFRKVAAVAVDTKVGAGADTAVSFVARKATDAVNFVGRKTGLSKLKVDASGKVKRKKTNLSIKEKIEQANRNMVEQEARDIADRKAFEREKAEGLEQMEYERQNRFPVDDVHVPKV